MERRSYYGDGLTIEKRADGGNVLHGYAAVFYRQDDPGTEYELRQGLKERVLNTAFTGLASGKDVKAMWNHKDLLGSRDSGTLRLSIDNRGLKYEIDLPDTTTGRDVAVLVSRGDVRGSSFGFIATKAPIIRDKSASIRSLESVELLDVGPVIEPAYKGTTVGMRSESHEDAEAELIRFQTIQRAKHKINYLKHLHS